MRRLTLMPLLLLATACHQIYGYAGSATDRGAEPFAADGGSTDSRRDGGAFPADQRGDAPPDAASADLPPVPDAAPDAAGTCGEVQPLVFGAACGEQHPGCSAQPPVDDADCDGLLADADGRPAECNPLLLFDGFDRDFSGRWTLAGDAAWSCGQIAVRSGGITLSAPLSATLGLAPVVQLRGRYNSAPAAGQRVRLGVNVSGTTGLWCELAHDGSLARLGVTVDGLPGATVSVSLSPGTTYVLQALLDASPPRCALFSSAYGTMASVAVLGFAPSAVGELRVEITDVAVTLDHMAVFAPRP